jgi:hypothetical protein
MATTTTNYGFDIPQSTDLVKDGATAIATLGQDIDTAMNTALGTKKSGMVLLSSVAFSGVSSQSINDVFSATYDHYKVTLDLTATSTSAQIAWRARVSGSDNSSSNYIWNRLLWNSNATPGTSFTGSNGLTTWGYFADANATSIAEMEINGMFAATKAKSISSSTTDDGATGIAQIRYGAGMSVTTSYTGITILPTSGTITGSVSIYGYNK